MLQLTDAGKRFGPKTLFEHADWLIGANERTALVGANGTGKSTLLKILAGMDTLEYGSIQRTRGMTIGYLPQEGLSLAGRTIFEECLSVFAELREMEREFESLAGKLADLDPESPEYASAAERYSAIESRLRAQNGYALDAQVGAVLDGLGFSKQDWTRPCEEFSGGWQMRIAMAKLLLVRPSLLLLDEPTNHLDLETRNWFENYLRDYPNGYILISHDRYFLDVTVDKIIEIWNRRLNFYQGNYERYLKQKEERRNQLESAYRNQKEHIDHLEAFISRFRYQATKAKQVQSRIKELEKIVRIEIPPQEQEIHFNFPQPPASGRTVVEAKDLAKSYGPKQVFSGVDFTIERGDRVALVGVNGAGKSTMIRMLAAQDQPTGGELRFGHNVVSEYFAQDQYKVLDPEARMLDDISSAAPRVPTADLRSLLGCFLFSGDDAFKPLGVLSGGERNRYALARILVSPANLLLLDEPTNHLDLRAKDVLLEAIAAFTGTVVLVSHDRYFLNRLATRVFEIEGGHVEVYGGDYEGYMRRKEALAAAAAAPPEAAAAPPEAAAAPPAQPAASQANGEQASGGERQRRLNPIKLRQIQERSTAVEEEIPRLEDTIAETERALGVFVSMEETQRLSRQLEDLRVKHNLLLQEWESLTMELEAQ